MNGKIRSKEVWGLVGVFEDRQKTQEQNNRLGQVMKVLGFERIKARQDGSAPEWHYAHGTKAEREQAIVARTVEDVSKADKVADLNDPETITPRDGEI